MIDRSLLRYLLAVVDHGTFTRAAVACGVSQPSLSAGIAKFEEALGTPLLLRSSKRVELTATGSRWVARARRIEREFTLGEQEVHTAKFSTTLRLGLLSSLPKPLIQKSLALMQGELGPTRLEVIEADEKPLFALLDRGRIDVALGRITPGRRRFSEELYTEAYHLALPADHPLAERREIRPEELAESAMIVRRNCEILTETSRYFTAHGVRPFMSVRATTDEMALAALKSGLGLTVMPAGFANTLGIAMVPLAGFALRRTVGLIYHQITPERPRSAALNVLKRALSGA